MSSCHPYGSLGFVEPCSTTAPSCGEGDSLRSYEAFSSTGDLSVLLERVMVIKHGKYWRGEEGGGSPLSRIVSPAPSYQIDGSGVRGPRARLIWQGAHGGEKKRTGEVGGLRGTETSRSLRVTKIAIYESAA